MNIHSRSIASVAVLIFAVQAASAQLPAGAAQQAPGPKAAVKLQKDAVIEIDSKFFEVPEAEAIRLGMISGPEDLEPKPAAAAEEKKQPKNPPILPAVKGILDPAAAARLLKSFHEAKGVSLLSAPRLTTRSGQRAVIEVIREFRYATEWEYDKVNKISTPTAFETRNIGVTLEVEPLVRDEDVIDLELVPQVVKLEGYVRGDDGQPVPLRDGRSVGADMNLKDMAPVQQSTAGAVLQPIFSTRKARMSVSMFSGQTLLMGGLRKDVQPNGKDTVANFLYVIVTARRMEVPAAHPDVLPVAFINKNDEEGFVRSPYAPEARPVDVRDLPSGSELKCSVTKKLFRVP